MKLVKNGRKKRKTKLICNAFNKNFNEMGIYRGQVVSLKTAKFFEEFNIRPFTLREIYKFVDNLNKNKAPGRDTSMLGH